jgi:hypothetical protein
MAVSRLRSYEQYFKLCDEDDEEEELFNENMLLLLLPKLRAKRRFWVHDTIARREQLGEFHTLIKELEADDERFKAYFRLNKAQFNDILQYTERDLSKQVTHYRRPMANVITESDVEADIYTL